MTSLWTLLFSPMQGIIATGAARQPPLVLLSAYAAYRDKHGIRDPEDGQGVDELCRLWYADEIVQSGNVRPMTPDGPVVNGPSLLERHGAGVIALALLACLFVGILRSFRTYSP